MFKTCRVTWIKNMHLVLHQTATSQEIPYPPVDLMATPKTPGGQTPDTCPLSSMPNQLPPDMTARCLVMPRPWLKSPISLFMVLALPLCRATPALHPLLRDSPITPSNSNRGLQGKFLFSNSRSMLTLHSMPESLLTHQHLVGTVQPKGVTWIPPLPKALEGATLKMALCLPPGIAAMNMILATLEGIRATPRSPGPCLIPL